MEAKDEETFDDLRNPEVVTKYRKAGDISNEALLAVTAACKPGAKIIDLCNLGDKTIEEAMGKIYNGKGAKKIEKGVGFPTSISVNNCVGHFCPLEDVDAALKEGDLVKIDLGAQVDGYCAVVADSFVLGEEGPTTATGKYADVLAAAYTAGELAVRMMKAGGKNSEITEMINKIADDFKVQAVQGVLSHEMTRNTIDGSKVILSKGKEAEHKVEEFEFAPNQVFAVDIVMSTGEGKPKEVDTRATVYKRASADVYKLKMKASRAVLSDIAKRFPTFPFALRSLDSKTARFGISECLNHDLVQAYPVLYEKEGDLVAHYKFTALLMPNGTIKVAAPKLSDALFKSEFVVTDEALKQLMQSSAGKKKKKKKPTKKAAGGETADAEAE